MRRSWLIGLLVVLLAGGSYFVWQQQVAQQAPLFDVVREYEVGRSQIEATVNATGTIQPEALVSLTFGVAGTIQQVNVVRGQLVLAGEVLATLETAELALAVQQAADAMAIQQLTLAQRRDSQPSPATLAAAQADIAAAEANVLIAQANREAAVAGVAQAEAQKALLLAGASEAEIAAAEVEVSRATVELTQLQESYDNLIRLGVGGPAEEQTRRALGTAQKAADAAEVRLRALRAGPRAADIQAVDAGISAAQAQVQASDGNIAAAQANLARAQAAYDRLLEGLTPADLAILEAQVKSTETNLALAQLRLQQSQIVAPISGRVANVLIHPGEKAAPGAPAINVVDEGAFHLEIDVDEIDIEQVAIGQLAHITLDALPEQPVTGVIAEIAPTPTNLAGVVSFVVTINITEANDVALRPGMSASASIVVEEIADVLTVPNWAIRLDRETGNAFVQVLQADGSVAEVVVDTGLRNDQFSQVLSGLEAGQRVVVTNEREQFSLFGGGQ